MTTPPLPWQPAATRKALRQRADLLHRIREFFRKRGVLEVETPYLLTALAPELHQEPMACQDMFLHTSPETAMKRLLAAGLGAIYQICHVFRQGECGTRHNPEFTLLEWYRPGWSHHTLMAEVETLLWSLLPIPPTPHAPAQVLTYAQALQRFAAVDPFESSDATLARACDVKGLPPPDRAELLDRLVVQRVEPGLKAMGGAVFLVDFPADAAAMAEIDPGPPAVAKRFELYLDGIELANGYQELRDPKEQRRRLVQTNRQRQRMGKPPLPIDATFLEAMTHGLPVCAGVAIGLDRLIMMAIGATTIREVMAFPFDRTGRTLSGDE